MPSMDVVVQDPKSSSDDQKPLKSSEDWSNDPLSEGSDNCENNVLPVRQQKIEKTVKVVKEEGDKFAELKCKTWIKTINDEGDESASSDNHRMSSDAQLNSQREDTITTWTRSEDAILW